MSEVNKEKPPITGNVPRFRATDAEIQGVIKARHLDKIEMPVVQQRMTAMTIIFMMGVAQAQRDADVEWCKAKMKELCDRCETPLLNEVELYQQIDQAKAEVREIFEELSNKFSLEVQNIHSPCDWDRLIIRRGAWQSFKDKWLKDGG